MKKKIYTALSALLVIFAGSIAVGAASRCDTPTPANDSWTSVELEYDPEFLGRFGLQTTEEGLRALYDARLENDKAVYESCYNEKYGAGNTQPPESTQPTQPTQPVQPSQPEQPTQPVQPSQPEQPVQNSQRQNIEAFVKRMYNVALNRDAEYDGLMFWSNGLENYEYDGASIARGFFCSKEFINRNLSNEEFVATLYRTFFNREADPEGWNCWIGVLNKGYSRTYVLSGFVNSKEFANLCDSYGIARGTMERDGSNVYNAGVRNFVLRNYTKALGRTGETEGVEYWCHLINTKQTTALDVAQSFFHSKEFREKNLSNEQFVEVCYQTFLDRSSDSAGKAYWLQVLARGKSRDEVMHGFAYSKEFKEIMSRYGLKTESDITVETVEMNTDEEVTMEVEANPAPTVNVKDEQSAKESVSNESVSENQLETVEMNTDEEVTMEVESYPTFTVNVKYEQSLARNEVLRALNEYRVANGVGEVTWDYWIEEDAMYRAVESMIYPGHTELTERWNEHLIRSEDMLSNNMWVDLTNEELADNIIAQFDRSPAHKVDLLDSNATRVGIGIATNGYGYYVIIRLSNG